jgi:hypothetical protein
MAHHGSPDSSERICPKAFSTILPDNEVRKVTRGNAG